MCTFLLVKYFRSSQHNNMERESDDSSPRLVIDEERGPKNTDNVEGIHHAEEQDNQIDQEQDHQEEEQEQDEEEQEQDHQEEEHRTPVENATAVPATNFDELEPELEGWQEDPQVDPDFHLRVELLFAILRAYNHIDRDMPPPGLPGHLFDRTRVNEVSNKVPDDLCPICLDEFQLEEQGPMATVEAVYCCCKLFHRECYKTALGVTTRCPYCNQVPIGPVE